MWGTNYACNFSCDRDQISLQSWFKRGLTIWYFTVFYWDQIEMMETNSPYIQNMAEYLWCGVTSIITVSPDEVWCLDDLSQTFRVTFRVIGMYCHSNLTVLGRPRPRPSRPRPLTSYTNLKNCRPRSSSSPSRSPSWTSSSSDVPWKLKICRPRTSSSPSYS